MVDFALPQTSISSSKVSSFSWSFCSILFLIGLSMAIMPFFVEYISTFSAALS